MVKLSPKDFITQLELMYKKQGGSVFLTFKHFTGVYSVKKSGKGPLKQIPVSKNPNDPQPNTPMLLIRASDGNKKKISALKEKISQMNEEYQLNDEENKHNILVLTQKIDSLQNSLKSAKEELQKRKKTEKPIQKVNEETKQK